MMPARNFCTSCGAPLVGGMRFCSQCGHPVVEMVTPGMPVPPVNQPAHPALPVQDHSEQILGIVPFIEQGLLSIIHYTLIVTSRRLIFCTWDPDTDGAMSGASETVMLESCAIEETSDEITHFRAKDWTPGPWQRYRSMAPDAIIAGNPGTIAVPFSDIVNASIVCETRSSTQDTLHLRDANRDLVFDLMYSQGPYLFRILEPLIGERVRMADHLHKRHGLDRLISGEEYK